MTNMTFWRCPDCKKNGVHLKLKGHEDAYLCRYCEFWVFAQPDSWDHEGGERLEKLGEANPGDDQFWYQASFPMPPRWAERLEQRKPR